MGKTTQKRAHITLSSFLKKKGYDFKKEKGNSFYTFNIGDMGEFDLYDGNGYAHSVVWKGEGAPTKLIPLLNKIKDFSFEATTEYKARQKLESTKKETIVATENKKDVAIFLNARDWYFDLVEKKKWSEIRGDEGHYLLTDKQDPKNITVAEHHKDVADLFLQQQSNGSIGIKATKRGTDLSKSIVGDWWEAELNENTRNKMFYTKRHDVIQDIKSRTKFEYIEIQNEEQEIQALKDMVDAMGLVGEDAEKDIAILMSYFRSMTARFVIGGTRATPTLVLHGKQRGGKSRWTQETSMCGYRKLETSSVGSERDTIMGVHNATDFMGGVVEWAEMKKGRGIDNENIKD